MVPVRGRMQRTSVWYGLFSRREQLPKDVGWRSRGAHGDLSNCAQTVPGPVPETVPGSSQSGANLTLR